MQLGQRHVAARQIGQQLQLQLAGCAQKPQNQIDFVYSRQEMGQRERESEREGECEERRDGNGGQFVSSSVACRSVRRQFSLRIWTFGIAHIAFCAALRIRPIVHSAQLSCTRKRVLLLLLVCVSVSVCVCGTALFGHSSCTDACKQT